MKLKDHIESLKLKVMELESYNKALIARKDMAVLQYGNESSRNEMLTAQLADLIAENEELKRQLKMQNRYNMAS